MTDWENYVNRPSQVPTLVRVTMSHYQFERPFTRSSTAMGVSGGFWWDSF